MSTYSVVDIGGSTKRGLSVDNTITCPFHWAKNEEEGINKPNIAIFLGFLSPIRLS